MTHFLFASLIILTQLLPIAFIKQPIGYLLTDNNRVIIDNIDSDKKIIYQSAPPVKHSQSLGILTSADSVLVLDSDSQTVLFQKNPRAILPIASITKLMTALVFLDYMIDFNKEVNLVEADQVAGGNVALDSDDIVTVRDLFNASLVGSANNATEALARLTGIVRDEFINKMNQRAKELGLNDTIFEDVTGLSPANVSTAYDIAKLSVFAFDNAYISEVTTQPAYEIVVINTKRRINIENTNKLYDTFLRLTGSKTGYTEEAGYCLTVSTDDSFNHRIIVVVLNSNSSEERFQETKGLISWAYDNWEWSDD